MIKKTVLIVVPSRARVNFLLRNGLLEELRAKGFSIAISTPFWSDKEFIREFGSVAAIFPLVKMGKLALFVASLRGTALTSRHETLRGTREIKNSRTKLFLNRSLFRIRVVAIARSFMLALLPSNARNSEKFWDACMRVVLSKKCSEDILSQCQPHAVIVGTAGAEGRDVPFILSASRRRIPVVAVDHNLDAAAYRYFSPPWGRVHFVCFGEPQAREFHELHAVPRDYLHALGALRYDRYFQKFYFETREVFLRARGLDPSRPVIFLGAKDPRGFPYNLDIIDMFKKAIAGGALHNAQLYVRFDPGHDPSRYGSALDGVAYERGEEHFELAHIANLLCHSAVYVGLGASTLALEALAVGTPALWIGFDGYAKPADSKDSVRVQYDLPAWIRVRNTGGIPIAYSEDEMLSLVEKFLYDKNALKDRRDMLLRQEYANATDGKAAERIVALVNKLTSKS